ncbi:PEARLI-4 domain-containing protein [Cephalotus follicularis]|uniref:PEARLI-4 domain-containing protein n=1 Tax=Cephalotus follicularis TaxID=3775 RepID=A0A1Q3BIV7_CEPFO|nr:PEARLI-4 domain-containing protein [Cephalotus follicularis]
MPESVDDGVTQASEHSPKESSNFDPPRRSNRIRLMNVQVKQHSLSLEKMNLTPAADTQVKDMPCFGQNRKKLVKHGRHKKVIPEDVGKSNARDNVNVLNVGTGNLENMSKKIFDVAARPISCPIWRGSFNVCNESIGFVDVLAVAAHMSNKACPEVFGMTSLLPKLLKLKVISRNVVWPQSFNHSAPTDNVIDLYIFPENESSEREFNTLMDYMTRQDLAMNAVVGNTVLLFFTSLQLPCYHWRTLGKYYLWAVFSGENAFFPYPQDDQQSIPKIVNALSSSLANDICGAIEEERNLYENVERQGSSHQTSKRKFDPAHILPCTKSKMFKKSDIISLAQGVVEEHHLTGRTVTEDGSWSSFDDAITETWVLPDSIPHEADTSAQMVIKKDAVRAANEVTVTGMLTDSIPHEADTTARHLVEKVPATVGNEVIDQEARRNTAIIAGTFSSAISKYVVSTSDVEVAITAPIQELLPASALQGLQEGEGASSLDQEGIRITGASSGLHIANALNESIRVASEIEVAPIVAHNAEISLHSVLQGCNGEQGAHTLDRQASRSIGTSVLHMATAFDEIISEAAPAEESAAEQVNGYHVKEQLAPILHAIIKKHGDIARDCPLTSSEMLASALERVCKAVLDFEAIHFSNLRSCHLKSLYSAIKDAELVNLDMKWLRNRYLEVMETVQLIQQYKDMKVSRMKNVKVVESKKRALELKKTEMAKLQSDIQSLESEVAVITAKNESLHGVISNVKSKCKHFCRNSLTDGLL